MIARLELKHEMLRAILGKAPVLIAKYVCVFLTHFHLLNVFLVRNMDLNLRSYFMKILQATRHTRARDWGAFTSLWKYDS